MRPVLPAPLSSLPPRDLRGPGRPRGQSGAADGELRGDSKFLLRAHLGFVSRERRDPAFAGSEFWVGPVSVHDTGEWPHSPREGRSPRRRSRHRELR